MNFNKQNSTLLGSIILLTVTVSLATRPIIENKISATKQLPAKLDNPIKENTDRTNLVLTTTQIENINRIRSNRNKSSIQSDELSLQQHLSKQHQNNHNRKFSGLQTAIQSYSDLFKLNRNKKVLYSNQRYNPAKLYTARNTADSTLINVLVNGADSDTIIQGDSLTITVIFSDGYTEADLEFWIDMDGDGIFNDSLDYRVDEGDPVYDNSDEDEDPSDGIFQLTFLSEDDGPHRISNLGFFLLFEDGGGFDHAFVYVEPIDSDYSVSGTISPGIANIFVGAVPYNDRGRQHGDMPWMTVTNELGHYENFVPDTGTYFIFSQDFFGVTDGMFSDTVYFDIVINGNLSGFDFNYVAPSAWVEGTVLDEHGTPLQHANVWAGLIDDFLTVQTQTDSSGYYNLGVFEDEWQIGVNIENQDQTYLHPNAVELYIPDGVTENVDFTVYHSNAIISGTVFLDDGRAEGVGIGANSEIGWVETWTDPEGMYSLPVSSFADEIGGYNVYIFDIPPHVIVTDHYDEIPSGSEGINFHLYHVTGAVEGYVVDSETLDPIVHAWVGAWDGMSWYNTSANEDGFYHLPLPNGTYEIYCGADDYYQVTVSNVIILDNTINLEFSLEPILYEGSLFGYVYSNNTEDPLVDAEVDVWNDHFYSRTYTDTSGFYYFDLPNDLFNAKAWKEGFTWQVVENIEIDFNDVQQDFYLDEIIINSVIEGVVFDVITNDPIIGAHIAVFNDIYDAETVTGFEGFFHLNVPSGIFMIDAFAGGYAPHFRDSLAVEPEDSIWLEIGLEPISIQPPHIFSVEDIPDDQGGQVRVMWWAGDPAEYEIWTNFSVWRLVPGSDPIVWDFISLVPYHTDFDAYSIVAPTLIDSNTTNGHTDEYWSVFMVTAHTFNLYESFDSEPAAGYSVDNLIPHTPDGLFTDFTPDGMMSTWSPPMDEDFQYFAIYRTQGDGFEPEPFSTTTDTFFHDLDINWESGYYEIYITAFDFNGNESDSSHHFILFWLDNDEIVNTTPNEYALYSNYPNPFNPTTTIKYGIPSMSHVTLIIYDAMGREVKTLVDATQEMGYHLVNWDGKDRNGRSVASGIYFSRMTASGDGNDFIKTRKMVLLR